MKFRTLLNQIKPTRVFIVAMLMCYFAWSTSQQINLNILIKSSPKNYYVNALFLTDSGYDRPPLVVISHGSPIDPSFRQYMVPEKMLGQAQEFFKLGFAVLIVERRGYGRSHEKYEEIVGDCDHRDNMASGAIASSDILGALDYAQENLDINPERVVLVGHSAGGFSSIFASHYVHRGVQGVINFAGGRGARGNNIVCSENNLLETYSFVGKTSRVPSLWVYNQNDKAFSPELSQSMFHSFTLSGGIGEFLMLPPFQNDGHGLFSISGIPIWQPVSKQFLKRIEICPLCD